MKCPNCGKDLPDGKLYCDNCGTEVEIVSDIDMELEMHKTIKNIANEQFPDDYEFDDDVEFDDDDNPSILRILLKSGSRFGKIFYVIISVLILTVIIFAIRMGIKVSRESSLDYQVEMAQKAIDNDDYLKAVTYLERAVKLDPENPDYRFQLADYYKKLDRTDDCIYILTDAAENKNFDNATRIQAYNRLFAIYKDNADYSRISYALEKCDIESVLSEYSSYRVTSPEFNLESGTYKDTIIVRITTPGDGDIYYTTDGSDPVTSGTKYTEPLTLEYGSYTVKAVVFNDYDIPSEVVTKDYLIDIAFSFAPEVEPESGDYEHTFLIEVDVPVMYTCYYTTDGSDPTKESNRYINPVPAAEGYNTYKFVVYANDGTQSEIVERNYNVVLNTSITAADAVTALNQGLIDRGYLDESGRHREGVEGTYIFMYSTIYPIEGMGDFYFVVEYIQDDLGNNRMTGTYYAIDCYNGMLYTVDVEGENGYVLSPL